MKKLAKSNSARIFASTVPVLHPVRSARGSSFFMPIHILSLSYEGTLGRFFHSFGFQNMEVLAKQPKTIQEQIDLLKSRNIKWVSLKDGIINPSGKMNQYEHHHRKYI